MPFSSTAQFISWYNSAVLKTHTSYQTLVRNWDDQKVVTCYNTNGSPFFACSDVSGFMGVYNSGGFSVNTFFSDSLPPTYSIRDMIIKDDIVFFCGSVQVSTQPLTYHGIVGFFDLNDFEHGNFHPIIHEIPNASYFTKLVVYKNQRYHKVVTIGYDTTASCNSILLEINNIALNAPTCNLHPMPNNIQLNDILFTGNSVILTGTVNPNYLYPFVWVLDNPANLSQSSSYYYFYYWNSGTGASEANANTHATYLGNGLIAVSYVYVEPSPQSFYTRLRVIDINANTPQNIKSQEFEIDDKLEPLEMTYSNLTHILTLLQPIDYTYNQNPQFIFLSPFTTSSSYNANLSFFQNGSSFISLDTYNSTNVVAAGDRNLYLQQVTSQNNSGCPSTTNKKVFLIRNSQLSLWPIIITPTTVPSSSINPTRSSHSTVWGTSCCSN